MQLNDERGHSNSKIGDDVGKPKSAVDIFFILLSLITL